MKKNIIVIFGGKSTEHDISIITGIQTLNAIDKSHYKLFPIYISKSGIFYTGEELDRIETYTNFNPNQKGIIPVTFISGKPYIAFKKHRKYFTPQAIDCAIICCHGAYGEDGCVQGMLEISEIPYSSCSVLSSSTCMNKKIMKDIFNANNLPIVPHIAISRTSFEKDEQTTTNDIISKLPAPYIIKPASSGSSIGINKATSETELKQAIKVACCYDETIIIEKCIENMIEVNCAVLKIGEKIITSSLEQPISKSDILSFTEKYLSKNIKGEKLVLNEKEIKLSANIKNEIKSLAIKAFNSCCCDGVVRIDFIVENKHIFVNEINTIPGSMSHYLFEDKYTYSELIDNLIASAYEKYKYKQKNEYLYSSPAILEYLKSNKKIRLKRK